MRGAGASFLQDVRSWIWMPAGLSIEVSLDGVSFRPVATIANPVPADDEEVQTRELKADLEPVEARWIRFWARNPGPIPEWHPGHGSGMIVFVDELIVDLE